MSCEGRIPTTAKNLIANNSAMHMRVSQQDHYATSISKLSILLAFQRLTSRYEHTRDAPRFEVEMLAGHAPFLHLYAAISITPGYESHDNSDMCEPSKLCMMGLSVLDVAKTPLPQDARLRCHVNLHNVCHAFGFVAYY